MQQPAALSLSQSVGGVCVLAMRAAASVEVGGRQILKRSKCKSAINESMAQQLYKR